MFWSLIAVGLMLAIPLVIVLETWAVLPPGVQMGAFLFSIVLIFVALSRLLSPAGTDSHSLSQDNLSGDDSGTGPPLDTICVPSKGNILLHNRVA
jgi:hypothetical protein